VFTWSEQRAFSLFLFILRKQHSKFMPGKATKEDKTGFGSKNLRNESDKSSQTRETEIRQILVAKIFTLNPRKSCQESSTKRK
jgi:hypothetical protein